MVLVMALMVPIRRKYKGWKSNGRKKYTRRCTQLCF